MSVNSSSSSYSYYTGPMDDPTGMGIARSDNIYGDIIETHDMERNGSQGKKVAPYYFCFCVFCK